MAVHLEEMRLTFRVGSELRSEDGVADNSEEEVLLTFILKRGVADNSEPLDQCLLGLQELPRLQLASGPQPSKLVSIVAKSTDGSEKTFEVVVEKVSDWPMNTRYRVGNELPSIVYNPKGLMHWLQPSTFGRSGSDLEIDEMASVILFSIVHEVGKVLNNPGGAADHPEAHGQRHENLLADEVARSFVTPALITRLEKANKKMVVHLEEMRLTFRVGSTTQEFELRREVADNISSEDQSILGSGQLPLVKCLLGLQELPFLQPSQLVRIEAKPNARDRLSLDVNLDVNSDCPMSAKYQKLECASATHGFQGKGWRVVYNPKGLVQWLQKKESDLEDDQIASMLLFSIAHEVGHVINNDTEGCSQHVSVRGEDLIEQQALSRLKNHDIEYRADAVAHDFMAQVPMASACEALKKMQEPSTITHPSSVDRSSRMHDKKQRVSLD